MPLKDLADFALSSQEIMVTGHTSNPTKPFIKADPQVLQVSCTTASFQIRVRVEISCQEHANENQCFKIIGHLKPGPFQDWDTDTSRISTTCHHIVRTYLSHGFF